MPNDNRLLQTSDTDLIEAANVVGKIYDGSEYIKVDNERDKISLKPKAITKILPTNTVHVETEENLAGNTVYKLRVPDEVAKSYDGIYPVQVDNNSKEISVNNVNFDVQFPLYGTLDNDTLTLGSKFGYHFSSGASGTVSNEVNYVAYIDETGDPYIRIRDDSQNNSQDFGFLLKTLPPSGYGTYYFGANRQWQSKTYYKYGDIYTTKSINPDATTFYVYDVIQLLPKQEIEGILYIGNTVLDTSTADSFGNVKLIYDDGAADVVIAKTDVNFSWGYNFTNEIVIPFYYKNPENRNISLELYYDTGTRIANPSTLQIRFNGWIM